jgi:hypothetical protein
MAGFSKVHFETAGKRITFYAETIRVSRWLAGLDADFPKMRSVKLTSDLIDCLGRTDINVTA